MWTPPNHRSGGARESQSTSPARPALRSGEPILVEALLLARRPAAIAPALPPLPPVDRCAWFQPPLSPPPGHAPAGVARPPLHLGLSVRRGLPRARHRRGCRAAARQCRVHDHLPGRDQPQRDARCPRCPRARSSRLAHLAQADAPENISLLPLPPYAPELNPLEQVWARLAKGSGRRSRMEWQDEGYLRANFLGHRVWNSYDGIVDACWHAWNKLMNRPERLAPPHPSHLGQSGQQIGRRLTWSLAAPDHRRDQVQNPGVQSGPSRPQNVHKPRRWAPGPTDGWLSSFDLR